MKKRILILGLDTLAKKNMYQLVEMEKYGYIFDVLCVDKSSAYRKYQDYSNLKYSKVYSRPLILSRLSSILYLFFSNKYHHVELYAASRIGWVYIFLIKLFGSKLLLIERGDIGSFDKYSFLTKLSLNLAYKFSDHIWFKEPYMKPLLEKKGGNNMTCIPNAVPFSESIGNRNRNVMFVWANRLIEQRKFQWVVDILKTIDKSYDVKSVLCGLDESELLKYKIDFDKRKVTLLGYSPLEELYANSKFFLLPSSIVFGNYSLLESMASGVVPIVTKSESVDAIIQDGYNGIVTEFSYEAFQKGVERALALTDEEYYELSNNASKEIRNNYSLDKWGGELNMFYTNI